MNNLDVLTLHKDGITDFAYERNLLLKKSKAKWVLFLDSDEIAPPKLMTEIRSLLTRGPLVNGYYIKRKIIFLGKEIGEDKVLRLGKRGAGGWCRAVHETWNIKGIVGTLDGHIVHNTAIDLKSYIGKMNKYSTLHAIENKKEGKHSNIFKIIFYPIAKFVENLLAGRGMVFSIMQAFHSFLGWVKLYKLQND